MKKTKKLLLKESLLLGKIFKKVAPRIGASVLMEPEWGVVGQITFKSGRRSYFRYNTLDINPLGGSEIATDKDYSNFFMKKMGYPVVPGSKTFFSKRWAQAIGSPRRSIDTAYQHACKIGFPVIVKPNSGSQGVGVSLVHNKREFYTAVRSIFKHDRIVLVQRPVRGKDYRLVVLDKELITAYERIPLNVIGDGRSTIKRLLTIKQSAFIASRRDTRIRVDDPRIATKLKHQGLSFRSIPAKGQQVFLLDNANLSTGGDSVDVTKHVHPAFKKIAIQITRDMGLRLCGVDLMVEGNLTEKPGTYFVLEINAAPGLNHYTTIGKAQQKIVDDLYFTVLKHMEH
jgi:D-alanine-D-alanine ligase-like ATP-grasp enzyme